MEKIAHNTEGIDVYLALIIVEEATWVDLLNRHRNLYKEASLESYTSKQSE